MTWPSTTRYRYVGWFVYKQPGHKVILKRRGDIIVRPTFTENTVIRLPCSRSLRHHLLGSHIRSMMSVLRNQTRGKHIEGGVRGLLHLSRYQLPEVDAVLQELVQEVREVAAVAVKAVADSSGPLRGLSGGDAHVSSEQAATAVALAAAGAGRGAHTVFNFMVRHNSLKLLLDHQVCTQGRVPWGRPVGVKPNPRNAGIGAKGCGGGGVYRTKRESRYGGRMRNGEAAINGAD
ncbi:hypothetical protein Vretifemale_5484 [Volvox reticuliferus]|uniref:Uncharacterized protein n=1 Tax=Volvox reticuliferus TaxID=1737510 RepID=A0A8J4CBD4_9CHLO|nr:hypothetical protein Vretifemale_5484 [Volvox reticuliferus]